MTTMKIKIALGTAGSIVAIAVAPSTGIASTQSDAQELNRAGGAAAAQTAAADQYAVANKGNRRPGARRPGNRRPKDKHTRKGYRPG